MPLADLPNRRRFLTLAGGTACVLGVGLLGAAPAVANESTPQADGEELLLDGEELLLASAQRQFPAEYFAAA